MNEHSVNSMRRIDPQRQLLEKLGVTRERHDHDQQHAEQRTIISEMALPGFRFHPTEEELVGYYLRRMVEGRRNSMELIASLDIYCHDPWELPAMAVMGEKEWFFFCPRDKKYPNGVRPNRVTASGYWKATGTDRAVHCNPDFRCCVGLKKTLVFYTGRAPRGNKTDWIMNEYRLPKLLDRSNSAISGFNPCTWRTSMTSSCNHENYVIKNDVALCRIYRKSNSTAGVAVGATNLHRQPQSALTEYTCPSNSNTHPHNQLRPQQVTQSLKPDDYQKVSRFSAALPSGVCGHQLRTLPPLESTIAGIIEGSSASSMLATSSPLSCNLAGSFPAFPSSSHPYHQHRLVTAVATNNGNLQSSHALMAKLLMEETCYASGRTNSSSSVMPADGHGNSTQQVNI